MFQTAFLIDDSPTADEHMLIQGMHQNNTVCQGAGRTFFLLTMQTDYTDQVWREPIRYGRTISSQPHIKYRNRMPYRLPF